MKNEVGNVYKYLTVIRRSTPEEIKDRPKGKIYWHCLCKCGNEIDVAGVYLRSGNTKSCGCYKKEKIIASNEARGGCEGSRKPWYVLDEIIKELKTPMKKGEWTQKYQNDGGWHSPGYWDHMYKCSSCGSDGSNRFNFCPKCGLPMNDKALEILAKRSDKGDNEENE